MQAGLNSQIHTQITLLKELLSGIKYDNDYGNVVESEKSIVKIRNKTRLLLNLVGSKKQLSLNSMDELNGVITGLEQDKSQQTIGSLTNDEGMW
ncbi:hypothetical protein BN7_1699 [Wickerhamomyces ciferrii]|uniref:Uncharacterized protein n=1 Tax=Wickerhamomyces ciferrii (strain ATCC 14091 / BCRC 22168 / CBS 111 / JCM 3599 / NBRC 0793 / NRRL Y-1031 F-60-10) TaxID=1206466 RepID=K0KL63_WICCF|nr:uncharacterized protein BN7_1699 [Wickerhamomyces ciferrii]CCH42154.1 hypothetical protein BN7_1699 [Wickerhamomyces ciferrii]